MTDQPRADGLLDDDPRRIGPYRLLGRLGEGGMGTVYLGEDGAGRRVAVKLIHRRIAAAPDFQRHFEREVAAARRVARFCTAPPLDAGVRDGRAYLVTEYVPGPTLREAVGRDGPLTGSSLETLAVSIAVALRAIHHAGIVHRDLKPANVLLSPVGPKVIDFGVARLADGADRHSSAVVGTPAYMAPEQVSGGPITAAADVFAWGGVVLFAATGRAPFGDGPMPNVLYQVVHGEPDLTGLAGPLRGLVTRALAKDPARRPTPQQIVDELSERVSLSLPDSPPEPTAGRRGRPAGPTEQPAAQRGRRRRTRRPEHPGDGTPGAVRRRRRWAAVLAAAVLLVTGGVAALRLTGQRSEPGDAGEGSGPAVAASGAGSPSAAPAAGDRGNPLHGADVRFHVPSGSPAERQAAEWAAQGREQDAALLRALAAVPQAVTLLGASPAETFAATRGTVAAAAARRAVPVLVTNHLPLHECYEGGARDTAAYLTWLDAVARGIGEDPAVVILEPNSLAQLPASPECELGDAAAQRERFAALRAAVTRLKRLPRTAVYLDGATFHWPAMETMAERLIRAGIERADGFYINAADHETTDKVIRYGHGLALCVRARLTGSTAECGEAQVPAGDLTGVPHFVVDTARNGKGNWSPPEGLYKEPETWCNPPGRGVGARPTTDTGFELVDALLWITSPGMSTGRCLRGTAGPEDPAWGAVAPEGGQWWAELALDRARNAVPPLRP